MCLRRRVALDEPFLGCHKHAGDGTRGCERQPGQHMRSSGSPLTRPDVMRVLLRRVSSRADRLLARAREGCGDQRGL